MVADVWAGSCRLHVEVHLVMRCRSFQGRRGPKPVVRQRPPPSEEVVAPVLVKAPGPSEPVQGEPFAVEDSAVASDLVEVGGTQPPGEQPVWLTTVSSGAPGSGSGRPHRASAAEAYELGQLLAGVRLAWSSTSRARLVLGSAAAAASSSAAAAARSRSPQRGLSQMEVCR